MIKLSVVATLYCSSPYLQAFYQRISATVQRITEDYEIVLVNDGSPDDSLAQAIAISQSDERVKVVDLSRNFGHHQAAMAGLTYAEGEMVFLIDSDLEEPPECLEAFYKAFCSGGEALDVVYGVQEKRKGGWCERVGGAIFYRLLNYYSRLDLGTQPLTVRIMSRRYVAALLQHQESELFLAGVFAITGYQQQEMMVQKQCKGVTSYSLARRIHLMVRAITSFSSFPLKWIFYSGFGIAGLSFCGGLYLILRKLIYDDLINAGWTSVMVSIWFLGGLLLLAVGTIGIYIAKIFSEVKQRPNFIVRQVYSQQSA